MTCTEFHRLVKKLRSNKLTDDEALTCAKIIDDFIDLCDGLQDSEDENGEPMSDIFGTEGWQHRIGIDD